MLSSSSRQRLVPGFGYELSVRLAALLRRIRSIRWQWFSYPRVRSAANAEWQRGMATRNGNAHLSHFAETLPRCPTCRPRASGTARTMDFFAAVSSSTRGMAATALVAVAILTSLQFLPSMAGQCASLETAQTNLVDLGRCLSTRHQAPDLASCPTLEVSDRPAFFSQKIATDLCRGCRFGSSPTPGELMCGYAPTAGGNRESICCPIAARMTMQSLATMDRQCFCFIDEVLDPIAAHEILVESRQLLRIEFFYMWAVVAVLAGILASWYDMVSHWRQLRQHVLSAGLFSQALVLPDSPCCCSLPRYDVSKAQIWAKRVCVAVEALSNILVLAGTSLFGIIWTFGGCVCAVTDSAQMPQPQCSSCSAGLVAGGVIFLLGATIRVLVQSFVLRQTPTDYASQASAHDAERCLSKSSIDELGQHVGYGTACLTQMVSVAASAERKDWTTDKREWQADADFRTVVVKQWVDVFLMGHMPSRVHDANIKCAKAATFEDKVKLEAWADLMNWLCGVMGLEHAAVVFDRDSRHQFSRTADDYPGGKTATQIVCEGFDVIFGDAGHRPWDEAKDRPFRFVPLPRQGLARLDRVIRENSLLDARRQWARPAGGTVDHASLLVVVAICFICSVDRTDQIRNAFNGKIQLKWPDPMPTRKELNKSFREADFLDLLRNLKPNGQAAARASAAEPAARAAAKPLGQT